MCFLLRGQKMSPINVLLLSYRNLHRESVKQVTEIGLMYKARPLAGDISLVPGRLVGYTILAYVLRSI
jgi:hypothetical protein